jgi:hypothetical protein
MHFHADDHHDGVTRWHAHYRVKSFDQSPQLTRNCARQADIPGTKRPTPPLTSTGSQGLARMEIDVKKSLMVGTSMLALMLGSSGAALAQAGGGSPNAGATTKETGPSPGTASPAAGSSGASEKASPGASTESDGSGPGRDKGAAAKTGDMNDKGAASKGDGPTEKSSKTEGRSEKSKSEAKDQGDASQPKKDTAKSDDKDGSSADKSAATTGKSDGSAGSSKGPQLSDEQRTKVQTGFRSHKRESVKNLNISVNVGVAVPRSVTLYSVPEDVVVIVPEYRRYKYFVYEERIVIVDPETFEIVEIIILA